MKQQFHTEFKDAWERLVRYQINKWAAFHRWWLDYSKQKGIPLFFFRYEDIISSNPGDTFKDFFTFALELDTIKGTFIESRIDEVIQT